MKKHAFLALASLCLLNIACNKPQESEFDRGAMLDNMANAVIEPGLNTLQADLTSLHTSAQQFALTTDAANLDALKNAFVTAYKSFQRVKMYDLGPFMDYNVKAAMNTYPTDSVKIEANIDAGTYNLGTIENIAAIGFPALDYLLYREDNTATLNSFTIATDAADRMNYLIAITTKLKDEFDLVHNGWANYEASFIAADGNDAGSSTSILFNEFVKDIELLKNAKIGIPAGQQTGGQTLPTYVEGYYADLSIVLALENIAGLKTAFTGGAGTGFDDYIKDVEGDVSSSLADQISAQFDVCSSTVGAIGSPLSDKVDSDPTAVNQAYQEIKKLVTYTKTDMSSTLGLLITFQDNDGD